MKKSTLVLFSIPSNLLIIAAGVLISALSGVISYIIIFGCILLAEIIEQLLKLKFGLSGGKYMLIGVLPALALSLLALAAAYIFKFDWLSNALSAVSFTVVFGAIFGVFALIEWISQKSKNRR